jgi:hypothetical protein
MNEITKVDIKLPVPAQYNNMLSNIKDRIKPLSVVEHNFYKTQSQFMDNLLTLNQVTPLRMCYHLLADVEQLKLALETNYFKYQKSKIMLEKKKAELSNLDSSDTYNSQLMAIEIQEIEAGIETAKNYYEGAVRRLNAYVNQYYNILESMGKKDHIFTEEEYEQEEIEYHIKTAFLQALNSARSHGGIIDEGNHIYLFQLGINGAQAQMDVLNLLNAENEELKKGNSPSHQMILDWLDEMYIKYKNAPLKYIQKTGKVLLDSTSLHKIK